MDPIILSNKEEAFREEVKEKSTELNIMVMKIVWKLLE